MVDSPVRHVDEDGSTYVAEIVPPEGNDYGAKYHVDLVRASVDGYGLEREQRLTVGQHPSWMEAEEQRYQLEDGLNQSGLSAWGEDVQRLREQPFEEDVCYMAVTYPPEGNEQSVAHLLAIGEQGISSAKLAIGERDAVEHVVERVDLALAEGGEEVGLMTAQREAERNGIPTPTTPLFKSVEALVHEGIPEVGYHFDYNLFGDSKLSLEAHKTWHEAQGMPQRTSILLDLQEGQEGGGGEVVEAFEAQVDRLTALQHTHSLEVAMNEAERLAVKNGLLDGERDDPRLFTEGPPDPFTTVRQRQLAGPQYTVNAISANGESVLDVLKTWGDEDYERLVIPQMDWETAKDNATFADELLQQEKLQGAMQLVELAGIEAGVIDPQRDDPRLFTQGPLDAFQTIREQEIDDDLAQYGVTWRETQEWASSAEQKREEATLAVSGSVEATFEADDRLLQPLDPTVNYAVVVVQNTDPATLELAVQKVWQGEAGEVETASQILQTYDADLEMEQAQADRSALLDVYDQRGLEAMMHKAELQAMRNGHLDPHRTELGLFQAGPPDRFETLAQQLEGETNPYWNTDERTIDEPVPDPQVQNPYWRLETLPVNTPDGEPLGHALHMVVYDGVEHDPEAIGTPAMDENEPFRMLEMAHFETIEASDKFGEEFKGYLMPGLLEGPELAEEVARLEGHPVEWKTLEGQELDNYRDLKLTLTRDPADWQPYNPNAERDARIEAEGLYTDPIHQFTTFDEDEDDPKVEPAAPDFDL